MNYSSTTNRFPCNIMWNGENLVVVDTGEVFDDDEDGFYWTCLGDARRPIGRVTVLSVAC